MFCTSLFPVKSGVKRSSHMDNTLEDESLGPEPRFQKMRFSEHGFS